MNLAQEYENECRAHPNYGVLFSLPEDAYAECGVDDERVVMGESQTINNHGTTLNFQDVLLDGEDIGYVVETSPYNPLKPMTVQFNIGLPDDAPEELRANPHFVEGEWNSLRFATLKQLVDYRLKFATKEDFFSYHHFVE